MAQVANSKRIHLVANTKSGKGGGAELAELARSICAESGVELVLYEISGPDEFDAKANAAITAAKSADEILIAAGGDGTIRSLAEKAAAAQVRFGVVPCGTFNFFARTHHIPEDLEQAFRIAISGEPKTIRLGEVNGRKFLINASLGLYAQSIAEREQVTSRFGRKRLLVILSTIKTLLKPHRLLHVTLKSGVVETKIRTPMIFIGNNALQLRNMALSAASCLVDDFLAVVALKPVRGWEMLRVIWRGITGTLEKEERLDQFCTGTMIIETRRRHQMVALDGETFEMNSPFVVRSLPEVLRLIAPPHSVDADVPS